MLKGISQEKRNFSWHKKHTAKLKVKRDRHDTRAYNYSNGITADNLLKTKAEKQYQQAIAREKTKNVGWLGYLKVLANRVRIAVKYKNA